MNCAIEHTFHVFHTADIPTSDIEPEEPLTEEVGHVCHLTDVPLLDGTEPYNVLGRQACSCLQMKKQRSHSLSDAVVVMRRTWAVRHKRSVHIPRCALRIVCARASHCWACVLDVCLCCVSVFLRTRWTFWGIFRLKFCVRFSKTAKNCPGARHVYLEAQKATERTSCLVRRVAVSPRVGFVFRRFH